MSFLINPFIFGSAGGGGDPSALTVDATDFDGTNDGLERTSGLTGQADSVSGILSFWLCVDAFDATFPNSATIFSGITSGTGNSPIYIAISDLIGGETVAYMELYDSTGSNVAQINHDGYKIVDDGSTWQHFLISWNGATGAMHYYINDTDRLNSAGTSSFSASFANNTAADYSAVDEWTVGIDSTSYGSGSKINAGIAEFYFAPGQFLDFSDSSNRRKFITSLGKPADMGSTGSDPTGSAPLIYLHLDNAEAAANFATNRAGTGNFTVTGALTTRATSPSD